MLLLSQWFAFCFWPISCACGAVSGGHVISAVVGCAFRLALKDTIWVAAPISMSLALLAMQLTRTVHPPGADIVHSFI